jgi:hypothetical protein
MPNASSPKMLTIKEASLLTNINVKRLLAWIRNGLLPSTRVVFNTNSKILINEQDLILCSNTLLDKEKPEAKNILKPEIIIEKEKPPVLLGQQRLVSQVLLLKQDLHFTLELLEGERLNKNKLKYSATKNIERLESKITDQEKEIQVLKQQIGRLPLKEIVATAFCVALVFGKIVF